MFFFSFDFTEVLATGLDPSSPLYTSISNGTRSIIDVDPVGYTTRPIASGGLPRHARSHFSAANVAKPQNLWAVKVKGIGLAPGALWKQVG